MSMKSILLTMVLGVAAIQAMADACFENVTVHQRWPWSAKVDIDFEVSCDDTVDIKVLATWDGQSSPVELDKKSLSGSLYYVKRGAGHIVWDPALSGHGSQRLEGFRVQLAEDAAARDYLILNLLTGEYSFTSTAPSGGWIKSNSTYATTNMVFRRCPKGTFTMGASDAMMSRMGRNPNSNPQLRAHQVTLTDEYYIQVNSIMKGHVHSITSRADGVSADAVRFTSSMVRYCDISYAACRGSVYDSPSVNWPSTQHAVSPASLIGKARAILSDKLPAGWIIDLPTAAQWERACKATTPDDQYWSVGGTVDSTGEELTNFVKQVAATSIGFSTKQSASHETRQPNGWGIYDMLGLRAEFVLDQVSSTAMPDATNPVGPSVTSGNPYRCVNHSRDDIYDISLANRWFWCSGNPTTTWYSMRLCIHTRDIFK